MQKISLANTQTRLVRGRRGRIASLAALAISLLSCGGTSETATTTGGETSCTPGESKACVGPAGCMGGQSCKDDGSGYNPCDCGMGGAGGATGSTGSEGGAAGGMTACVPGSTQPCYDGPSGTDGVGECSSGVMTCNEHGTGFGTCAGEVLPAVENCETASDEDCNGAPCSGKHDWSTRHGDDTDQLLSGLAVDPSGAIVVSGFFAGSIDFGSGALTSAGGMDAFVAKLASAGAPIWTKGFGDSASQYSDDVAIDSQGNILLAGHFEGTLNLGGSTLASVSGSDVYVAKLDPMGNHLWSKRFGSAGNQAVTCMALDGQDNIIIATDSSVDFGGGLPLGDSVSKLDPSGSHIWTQSVGVGNGYVQGIDADSSGNVVLGGFFTGSQDVCGANLVSAGMSDVFLVKLSASGTLLWSERFGAVGSDLLYEVQLDSDGNVLITGTLDGSVSFGGPTLTGTHDMYLAKLTPTGGHVWSKSFPGPDTELGWDLAVDGSGGIVVAGVAPLGIDVGGGNLNLPHQFLARFSSSGSHIWSLGIGGKGSFLWPDINVSIDAQNGVFVGLDSNTPVNLGGNALAPVGGQDVIVGHLAP